MGAHRGGIKFARRKTHFRGLFGDQGRRLRRHKDARARNALGHGRARDGGSLRRAQRDCAPILVTSAAPTVTVIVPHDGKKSTQPVNNHVFIGNEGASGRARTQDERPVRFVAAGDVLRDRGGPRKAEKGAPRAIPWQKISQKVTIVTFFAIAISLTKFIKL